MCIAKSWDLQNVPFHHIDPPSMVNSKRARARKDTKKAYVIIFMSRPRSREGQSEKDKEYRGHMREPPRSSKKNR